MRKAIIILLLGLLVFSIAVNASTVSCFTYEIKGSSVYCIDCSTNATNYSWGISLNETIASDTGWISGDSGKNYTFMIPGDGIIIITHGARNGTNISYSTKSLGYQYIQKDIYYPSQYMARLSCKQAGYYWYQDSDGCFSCHHDPETKPWNEKKILPQAGVSSPPGITIGSFNLDWGTLFIMSIIIVAGVILFAGKKPVKPKIKEIIVGGRR